MPKNRVLLADHLKHRPRLTYYRLKIKAIKASKTSDIIKCITDNFVSMTLIICQNLKVLVSLRYYASASFQIVTVDLAGVSQGIVSSI